MSTPSLLHTECYAVEKNGLSCPKNLIIDAYSSRGVADEIRRLKLMATTLDVDPQIKTLIVELANYSQEASKQKPHNVKDHWVSMALGALGKLEQSGTDRE
jgi:hypothetical protein